MTRRLLFVFALGWWALGCSTPPSAQPKSSTEVRITFSRPKKLKSPSRPGFAYRPGVLRPLAKEDIVRGPQGPPRVRSEYVVMLKKDRTARELAADLKEAGISALLVGEVPAFGLVQLRVRIYGPQTRRKIKALPSVKEVLPHYLRRVKETRTRSAVVAASKSPAFLKRFGLPAIWKRSRGRGVLIAVLDSGLDVKVPLFKGRIHQAYSVISGSPVFEDGVYYKSGDVTRVIDHGTRVAAMAALVAPEARVMPIQVLGFNVLAESIYTHDLAILEGLARALAFRADIINLSVGSDFKRLKSRHRRIQMDTFVKESQLLYDVPLRRCLELRVPVVVSAGNEGVFARFQPLAAHALTLSVGALDLNNRPAAFSNYGPGVDAFLPGQKLLLPAPGGNRFYSSGTSYSAPYLAGILALSRGLGVRRGVPPLRKALKKSNLRLRLSILPNRDVYNFDPGGFLAALGLPFQARKSEERKAAEFRRLYRPFFVKPGDPDRLVLRKIMGFYRKRGNFKHGEEEARLALQLAPAHLATLNPVDFVTAEMLSRARLSPTQLKEILPHLGRSDFAAIVFMRRRWAPARSLLYHRLKTKNFNPYTLHCLHNHGGQKVYAAVLQYLQRIQSKTYVSNGDETIAAWVLSYRKNRKPRQIEPLILKSLERFKADKSRPYKDNLEDQARLAEALLRTGRPEGLKLVLEALGFLEAVSPDKRAGLEAELHEYQWLLNRYTNFGVKFNYLAPTGIRKENLKRFKQMTKAAAFKNGRFVLP